LSSQYYQTNSLPYDISSGLPHNEINDIVKDNRGFVWIATENGLSRFDGYNFVNFNSQTHPSLFKYNSIKRIQQNGSHLYLLTKKDGLIEVTPNNLSFRKISSSTPLSIAFSGDTTAILFFSGVLEIIVSNKKINTLHFPVSLKDNLVLYKGKIYLSLQKQGIVTFAISNPSKTVLIPVLGVEKSGNLQLSKKYGLTHHNGNIVRILKNNQLVDHPELKGTFQITFFTEDERGNPMYIKKCRTINVKFKNENLNLLSGVNENFEYRVICKVSENSLLIGSNQGITNINKNPSLSEKMNDFSLMEADNMIVRRSIVENRNKKYYISYPYIIEQDKELKLLTQTILPMADGVVLGDNLFCATDGTGLKSINLTTKKITTPTCNVLLPNDSFEDISIFSDSLLLLVKENKIVVFNPKTSKGIAYYLKNGFRIHVAVQKTNSSDIYLGTNKGLILLKYTSRNGFAFVKNIGDKDLEIRDILLRESKNQIWLATNTGVIVMDLIHSKIIHSYSNPNQVSHPKVVKLIEDKNNCVWASTYSGVTVYNTTNGSIRFINKYHGLINTEFNYKSAISLRNGNLVFGGLNAFEIIHPNLISEFIYAKTFHISGIEKIKKEQIISFSNYTEGEIISFETGNEALKIYLANLDFQFGQGYIFEYSLDSKNWFKVDGSQRILLSNLSYGDYVLKIRMFNPFGQLVVEKSFPLKATSSFYVKTEFYILIFCLIILFCGLFIGFFVRSIRIRNKTRTKIAMDLHDESGTILTRLLLLSKREKFEEIEKKRLQNGLQEALFNFRTYVDALSSKKHTWQDLLDEIQEFVNSVCSDSEKSPSFTIESDDNYTINGELFRDIKLTVYEIITNSIKYSNTKQLSIAIFLNKNNLQIVISDYGKSKVTDLNEKRGNGLRNIKKRVTRNKGTYSYYNTTEMGGITVELNFPVK
jgi:two-component sensor histidine kinase